MTDNSPQDDDSDGAGAAAPTAALDPWGADTVADYAALFDEFGIERIDTVADALPDPHALFRRGVIFGHRGYDRVLDALAAGEPAAVLSGFMPTGAPHLGHKMVFDEIVWHQQQGADAYGLIADLEAPAARGRSWAEIDDHTRDYLLSLLAVGFDPDSGEVYRQSAAPAVDALAFELGIHANLSELQAIYGFDGTTAIAHMQAVLTQMADILEPQLEAPQPTVIPVGPDQDPHIRFARDLAARMRMFSVTEAYASFELTDAERALCAEVYAARETYAADPATPRCAEAAAWLRTEAAETATRGSLIAKLENAGMEPLEPRARVVATGAPEAALDALIEQVDGEKRRYGAHIDSFELSAAALASLARAVELAHGGYGFIAPSAIYHRFMSGLTGGKMSSSDPASRIALTDPPTEGAAKVRAATTAGQPTEALQRERGGDPDACPVYELYAYTLAGDDDALTETVYTECAGGERLCGDCKAQAAELMEAFLADHQQRRAAAEATLAAMDVELTSPRGRD